jgi:DNA/RNA endonuclease YhcR with UshA esterase domain
MKCRTMLLAMAGMAVSAFTASAHHSLDKTYDLKKEVRLEGKVLQLLLRNPHSFLQLEAPDGAGTFEVWALEFPSAGSLAKSGIKLDTLKNGDALVVTLHPSFTSGDHRGVLSTLHRESDGLTWDAHPKKRPKS